jgi:ring-1,2-phenylacetyl-CoA epoxidase subunit PaaC
MEPIKELIFKMADDALIIGHRNSEWTGIGPMMEEDIAFSSMAQDKLGHSLALLTILSKEMNEADADTLAFQRTEKDFKCCQLVELPIGDYAFSLIRHFLFDHSEALRYELLSSSSVASLANLAKKVKGEIKYHTLHADTWVRKLGNGTEESKARMQAALNEVYPYALGIFELSPFEEELINTKTFAGENELKKKWIEKTNEILTSANLKVPAVTEAEIKYGGRRGYHTPFLAPMLTEMREVISSDYGAEW